MSRLKMLSLGLALTVQILPSAYASSLTALTESEINEIDAVSQHFAEKQKKFSVDYSARLATLENEKQKSFIALQDKYPVNEYGSLMEQIPHESYQDYFNLSLTYTRLTNQYNALEAKKRFQVAQSNISSQNLEFFANTRISLETLSELINILVKNDDVYSAEFPKESWMPNYNERLLYYVAEIKRGQIRLDSKELIRGWVPDENVDPNDSYMMQERSFKRAMMNKFEASLLSDERAEEYTNNWLVSFDSQYNYWADKHKDALKKWENINRAYENIEKHLSTPALDSITSAFTPLGENYNSLGLLAVRGMVKELKAADMDQETALNYAAYNYAKASQSAEEEVGELSRLNEAFKKVKSFLEDIMDALRKKGKIS